MLSAGSFSSPYEHLSQPETKRMVEHYTAYLSDNTRLIANPGLKVHIHTAQCQPEPEVTHKHVLSYTSLSPEWQRTRHYRNQAWRYTNAHYKKKKKLARWTERRFVWNSLGLYLYFCMTAGMRLLFMICNYFQTPKRDETRLSHPQAGRKTHTLPPELDTAAVQFMPGPAYTLEIC